MGYKKKGRSYLVDSEAEYFENETGVALKPDFEFQMPGIVVEDEETKINHCFYNKDLENLDDKEGKYVKKGTAKCWVSNEFPLRLEDFLPVLNLLGQANPHVAKLQEFLNNPSFTEHFSGSSFPVKIDIPLTYTLRAIVSFRNYEPLDAAEDIFEIPEYRMESRKIAQKTMLNPKKRIILANALI